MNLDKFHVVCMISNPANYQRRYDLYRDFKRHMDESGINFWTAEVAQRDHPHYITDASDPRVLQLKTSEVLWHKERALSLLVAKLPSDWEYVCWIDADIEFPNWRGNHAWYAETWRMLQLYKVVQLWHNCVDMGPKQEIVQIHKGFAFCYNMGYEPNSSYGGPFWHPGYAWGFRREAWVGLPDWAILGAGDHHMATAMIGQVGRSIHGKCTGPYFDKLFAYQNVCERTIRRDMGFVPNTILHHWHGKKKDRRYQDRWDILTRNKFDPNTDLTQDYQGLYKLVDHGDVRSIKLKQEIRQYFFMRNEDSIDLD